MFGKLTRPNRTERGPETGAVVPLAELKGYCRVFDDNDDALIGDLAGMAQDILAGHLGRPVGEVDVFDYYSAAAGRLGLSAAVKADTTPTVKVRTSGGETTVNDALLDESTDPAELVFQGIAWPDPDPRITYPVTIKYTAAALTGVGQESLAHAIKVLVNEGYHHGGDAMTDTRAVERAARFLADRARSRSPGPYLVG